MNRQPPSQVSSAIMTDYITSYQAYETEDDESPDQFLINEDEAPVHVHTHGNGLTGECSVSEMYIFINI